MSASPLRVADLFAGAGGTCAMSFPKDYRFAGNRGEVVKQIGNAVPIQVATALCRTAIQALGGAA